MKQLNLNFKYPLTLFISVIFSLNVYAEPGDFGFWATLKNLVKPDKADNPVSSAETQRPMYPLMNDDPNFDYGFNPKKYDTWQQIDVPMSTGAMCSNGTPYKFYVRRVADTDNAIVYFEGGGACWDYESCSGAFGIRGARNPNGIPDDYVQDLSLLDFSSLESISTGGASPLIFTHHPWDKYKTGKWNIVYVPYCTGDIYVGDKTNVYEDPTGQEEDLVFHHNGVRNLLALGSWVKNNLPKPTQLAVAGCSAGSVGATLLYSELAELFDSRYGYLVNDSGPIFNAPRSTGDTDAYPQIPLQNEVIETWTTYDPVDPVSENPVNYLVSITPNFDVNNWGTLYSALSSKFPNNRLGMTHFLADGNYSSYSYERFYPEIFNDPDPESRLNKIRELWQFDTANNMIPLLDAAPNWSYYFPRFRDFNESHCTTILEFRNSEIQERNLKLTDFLDNVINYRGGDRLRAVETDEVSDFEKNYFLYDIINSLGLL